MKAILISIHSPHVCNILNLIKLLEIRKGTVIGTAITKLIEEQGVAPMLIYCTKGKPYLSSNSLCYYIPKKYEKYMGNWNGKVLARFNATAEEIFSKPDRYKEFYFYDTDKLDMEDLLKQSCLDYDELNNYLDANNGTAIHINDLEIFDEPKEISEFLRPQPIWKTSNNHFYKSYQLTRAPQSWCYVEV